MSLSPAAIAAQLKDSLLPEEVLDQVLSNEDNGVIWSHLVTNSDTTKKVAAYLEPRLQDETAGKKLFTELIAKSDPTLVGMSMLAQRNAKLRPLLLMAAKATLPLSGAPLNVLLRAGASEKLGPEWVPLVARYCDRRQSFDIVSLSAVVLANLLPEGDAQLHNFVIDSLKSNTVSSVIQAFSAVAVVASVNPVSGVKVFQDPAVLTPEISSQLFADEGVVLALLEMLSAVAAVPDARAQVASHFAKFIDTSLHANQPTPKLLAAVVRIKLIAGNALPDVEADASASELDDLSARLENYLEDYKTVDRKLLGFAIEGLASTANLPSVRRRTTLKLVKALAKFIESNEASWVYGSLSILSSLTTYPYKETKEQKSMRELRKKAQPSPFDVQPTLTPDEVGTVVDKVLESKVVKWLSQGSSRFTVRSRELTAVLVRNMASQGQKMRRVELASQGGVVVPLYLWSVSDEKQKLNSRYKSVAASAVAKILASIPPEVAFNDRFPKSAAVELLRTQIFNPDSERKNLDTFESLLALTNLASIDDDQLRAEIVARTWTKIEETLQTEFVQIQRASIELICNLTTSTLCAEILLAKTAHGEFLRGVLGNCLAMDDREGRLAAAGALAMLAEWEGAPEVLARSKEVMDGLIAALSNVTDSDMLLRVLSALTTMVKDQLKRDDDEAAEALIYRGGIARIEALVDKVELGRKDLAQLLVRLLRMLAKYKVKEEQYIRLQNFKAPPKTSLME